jgi:hypothetical protein
MSFKSVAEFLALTGDDAPTTAERKLIEATRAGQDCNLCAREKPSVPTTASEETRIRASILKLLITGGTSDCDLHESGVTLVGGWIIGLVDLDYCTARGQTALLSCHFEEGATFHSAHLQFLRLNGSELPSLFAQGLRVKQSVHIRNVTIKSMVY